MASTAVTTAAGPPMRVQLRRTKGWRKPEGAIVVARPNRWSNPFPVREFGLDLALALFRNLVRGVWNPRLLDHLDDAALVRTYELNEAWRRRITGHPTEAARFELRGRDLCCWCSPGQPCHADILLEIANL